MGKRLGKGLNALLGEIEKYDQEQIQYIPINECRTNPYQPRKTFDADALEELKASIIEYGIIQPLIVRKSIKGYEIVAGERRYRAAKEAGFKEVPVIVKDYDDNRMMEIALLENLQREDLTIIEEALAYKSLMETLNVTQDELAKKIGKSRSHIANTVRLLALPEDIIAHINSGELSMGHARALLGLKNKKDIHPLAKKIIKENLNVRQVEQLVIELNIKKKQKRKKPVQKDVFIVEQEEKLREFFGTNVKIAKGKNKGKIEIEFYSDDELNKILDLIKQ